jgi:purine-nucleoside phosphorylase
LSPAIEQACAGRLLRGASWTTDAPFRETEQAVAAAAAGGLMVVEMEAAGLYAFAKARGRAVLCLAHVSNRLGQKGDFEKGEADGAPASLRLIQAAAEAWRELGDANKSFPR